MRFWNKWLPFSGQFYTLDYFSDYICLVRQSGPRLSFSPPACVAGRVLLSLKRLRMQGSARLFLVLGPGRQIPVPSVADPGYRVARSPI